MHYHYSTTPTDGEVSDEDDDVADEKDRVLSGDAANDTLILHELTKVRILLLCLPLSYQYNGGK